jgi:hypothetical protein
MKSMLDASCRQLHMQVLFGFEHTWSRLPLLQKKLRRNGVVVLAVVPLFVNCHQTESVDIS